MRCRRVAASRVSISGLASMGSIGRSSLLLTSIHSQRRPTAAQMTTKAPVAASEAARSSAFRKRRHLEQMARVFRLLPAHRGAAGQLGDECRHPGTCRRAGTTITSADGPRRPPARRDGEPPPVPRRRCRHDGCTSRACFPQRIAGAPIPKQYCRITGDRSLLEATLARIFPFVPKERTLVVVNRSHLDLALPQLHDVPRGNVIAQPGNRDTGPGIVFALLDLAARRPRAPVVVFPSDHYVDDGSAFREHVERATLLVDRFPGEDHPARHAPDSSGARIRLHRARPATRRARPRIAPAYRVAAFHEKPSVELAKTLQRRGAVERTLAALRPAATE
jgi:hypothetical protein